MKHCLIIGGGAAGLMCAAQLAKSACHDLQITIIEHKDNVGYKLLASGNGRCNLTNILPAREFIDYGFAKEQRNFVKSAIFEFPPESQLDFFAENGVEAVLVDDFHYFPKTQKSSDVLNVFRKIIAENGVEILYKQNVSAINISEGKVKSVTSNNQEIECDFLVVACGGLSYPACGSDGSIFPILSELGMTMKKGVPALVGLQVEDKRFTALAGNVLKNAQVSLSDNLKNYDCGELLFTQSGISGPAVLDLSNRVARRIDETQKSVELSINLNADYDEEFWLNFFENKRQIAGQKSIRNLLHEFFFRSLVDLILELSEISFERKVSELSKKELKVLLVNLIDLRVKICDTDGFKKAIVTSGGIELNQVSGKTLEAKEIKNLFFAGELLDVDGRCGGYNLTWAFASGKKCAEVISKRVQDRNE